MGARPPAGPAPVVDGRSPRGRGPARGTGAHTGGCCASTGWSDDDIDTLATEQAIGIADE